MRDVLSLLQIMQSDNDSESYHSKAKDSLAVALTKQFYIFIL